MTKGGKFKTVIIAALVGLVWMASKAGAAQCGNSAAGFEAFQIADIERILGAAVARMLALKLAMRLLLSLGLFQRDELGLGQDQAFLGALGLQRFEPLVHGLEVMTLPHAAHAGGRDREPALAQFVGDADLTEGRLLDGQRNDGIFDLLCDAIFSTGFLRLISCNASSPPLS